MSSLEDSPVLGSGHRTGKRAWPQEPPPLRLDDAVERGLDLHDETQRTPALSSAGSDADSPSILLTPQDSTMDSEAMFRGFDSLGLDKELDATEELDFSCLQSGPQPAFDNFPDHPTSPGLLSSSLARSASTTASDKSRRRHSFFNVGAALSFGSRNKRGLSATTTRETLVPIHERSHERQSSTDSASSGSNGAVKRSASRKLTRSISTTSSLRPSRIFDSPTQTSSPFQTSFDQLPTFPCKRMQLSSYQERCEFLMKHQALNFGLGLKHGSFRPRLVVLCKWPEGVGYRYSLHAFKNNQPDDHEVERMRLSTRSVCHVTSEISGGRLYVLKVTGLVHVEASQREDAWYFSMNDQADLSDWLRTLKSVIGAAKSASVPSTPHRSAPMVRSAPLKATRSQASLVSRRSSSILEDSYRREEIGRVAHPFTAAAESSESLAWPINDEGLDNCRPTSSARRRGMSNESTFSSSLSSLFFAGQVADDMSMEREAALTRRLSTINSSHVSSTRAPDMALPRPQSYVSQLSPTSSSGFKRHSMASFISASDVSTPSDDLSVSSASSLFSSNKHRASSSSAELSDHGLAVPKSPPLVPPRSPLRGAVPARRFASIESLRTEHSPSWPVNFAHAPLPPLPSGHRASELYEVRE